MSEVNQTSSSFDSESKWINQSEVSFHEFPDPLEQQNSTIKTTSDFQDKNNNLSTKHNNKIVEYTTKSQIKADTSASTSQKMNWQRVAHKLREYNRKLLKKVFRLEQELAEIDNKFNKYVEKSQSSDLLLAQQAEEIKNHQEQFAQLTQQLALSQKQIDSQELIVQQIAEQHELSEKQAAQLERECTLLQEKYNDQAFQLVTTEQKNQELQIQLNQQQQNTLELEAKLKQYQESEIARKEKALSRHQNYPHNRYIQPWSTATIPEPKISLPRNTQQATTANKRDAATSKTIKTAAKIASWEAETVSLKVSPKKTDKSQIVSNKTTSKTTNSDQNKKPQSLAAIDLPTFPRPR